MAKTATVQELEKQHAALSVKRSEMYAKIRDLEHRTEAPELDPTMDFSEAFKVISSADQELRTARAMEAAVTKQLEIVDAAIADARQREREAAVAALRPAEDKVKVALVAAHIAYVEALQRALDMTDEIRHAGGPSLAHSALSGVVPHDLRREMRKQAERLRRHLGELAADVNENTPKG